MAEKKHDPDYRTHFVWPLLGVLVLSALVGLLPWLTGFSYQWGDKNLNNLKTRLEMLGTFGDMFGFLNATFSGVAFVAIYYTLRIQQKQHDLQLKDLNMSREIANLDVVEESSREVIAFDVPFGDKIKGKHRLQCPSNYVRLALENSARMPAKNCRVVLKYIRKKRPGEADFSVINESKQTLRFLQITEDDNAPENRGVTISHGLTHYFNILSVKEEPGKAPYCLLQVAHGQSKYSNVGRRIELNCDYEFCIGVESENSPPLEVMISISIGDKRESVAIGAVKAKPKHADPVYVD